MIPVQLMSAANAAVNQTSPGFEKGDLTSFSVQFVFSGSTLAGTVSIDCSNDNTNWVQVTGSPLAVTAAGNAMINVVNGAYRYVRAVWVFTSGTGTVTANLVVMQPANRF